MRPVAGAGSGSGRIGGWVFALGLLVALRLPRLSRGPMSPLDVALFGLILGAVAGRETARRRRARREAEATGDLDGKVTASRAGGFSSASRPGNRPIPA